MGILLTDEKVSDIALMCYTDNKLSCVEWAIQEGAKAQLKRMVKWFIETQAEVVFQYRKDEIIWEALIKEVKDGNNDLS